MGRLKRFEHVRFVGVRDTMIAYDCDDDDQFEELAQRVTAGDLIGKNLISSFAPDSMDEAANRGFKAR